MVIFFFISFFFRSTGSVTDHMSLVTSDDKYSEHIYIDAVDIMHVFNSSFWLIYNFDNNLY